MYIYFLWSRRKWSIHLFERVRGADSGSTEYAVYSCQSRKPPVTSHWLSQFLSVGLQFTLYKHRGYYCWNVDWAAALHSVGLHRPLPVRDQTLWILLKTRSARRERNFSIWKWDGLEDLHQGTIVPQVLRWEQQEIQEWEDVWRVSLWSKDACRHGPWTGKKDRNQGCWPFCGQSKLRFELQRCRHRDRQDVRSLPHQHDGRGVEEGKVLFSLPVDEEWHFRWGR